MNEDTNQTYKYLSGTNFRGYKFSKMAKICTREIFNFVETAKINTREKIEKNPTNF